MTFYHVIPEDEADVEGHYELILHGPGTQIIEEKYVPPKTSVQVRYVVPQIIQGYELKFVADVEVAK